MEKKSNINDDALKQEEKLLTKKKKDTSTNTKKLIKKTTATKSNASNKKEETTKNMKQKIPVVKSKETLFSIGTFIFYPNEGIGKIIDIEERTFDNDIIPYYVINFISQKMISRIPVKNLKLLGIRKIISKNSLQKVWNALEDSTTTNELPWKDRLLKHQEVLKKGNTLETAEMLASLHVRGKERPLSFQERQYYDFAMEALRDELAILLKQDNKSVVQLIKNVLDKNIDNTDNSLDNSIPVE